MYCWPTRSEEHGLSLEHVVGERVAGINNSIPGVSFRLCLRIIVTARRSIAWR